MPQVPMFDREVRPDVAIIPYQKANVDANTSGATVAQAMGRMGDSALNFIGAMAHIKDRIDETKMVEAENLSLQWQQEKLMDKENGYYFKKGKDAYGQSEALMQNYDEMMKDFAQNAKLSPRNRQRLNNQILGMRSRINEKVTMHDYHQGIEWSKDEAQKVIGNQIVNAVNNRGSEQDILKALATGYQVIDWSNGIQRNDKAQVDLQKQTYKQELLGKVLEAKISEGSLEAKAFFEKFKNDFDPRMIERYTGAIRNLETNYYADDMANKLMMFGPAEAYKQIQAIENLDMKDAVERRYNHYINRRNHQKREIEKQALDSFYNTALQKVQNGETLFYDDIPQELDAQTKLSLMEYVSKNGAPETQDDVWEQLYELKVNNAQEFLNLDLNKYRGYLSEGEYKQFLKDQQKIKSGGYYTNIKDDDKKINEALKSMGLDKNAKLPFKADKKDISYSEIRSMVREFEARKGRKISEEELSNVIKSLGYKGDNGTKIYQQLELGMRTRTGFIKDVVGDFIEYQNQHNGQMPSDEEKYKIINKRVADYEIQQNQNLYDNLKNQYGEYQSYIDSSKNNYTSPINDVYKQGTKQEMKKENDVFFGHQPTSEYGKRNKPTQNASSYHKGIDLAYKMNEPVRAFQSGVVVRVGKTNGLGNFVEIQDENGVIHSYGHNNKIKVNQGQYIKRGDEIALAGSTGASTGPHVHYSKKVNGKYINPLKQGGNISEGTVIKNATGQRMVMRNGQWQAI